MRMLRRLLLLIPVAIVLTLVGCESERGYTGDPNVVLDIVKPHFFAHSSSGILVEVQGVPDRIVEHNGKAKIRMRTNYGDRYVDPLALESALLGEHPSEKLLRLQEAGVPMSIRLSDDLFHTLRFEYLPGKETSGIISEVFPDGTFLVIPDEMPEEWRSNELGAVGPTLLHVDPRALITRTSPTVQEYEEAFSQVAFEDWGKPPAAVMQHKCDLYKESIVGNTYTTTLASVGYRFTRATNLDLPDRIEGVTNGALGPGGAYFGFGPYWVADRMRDLGVSEIGECDTVYKLRGDYLSVRRLPEENSVHESHIVHVFGVTSSEVVYKAPGLILAAMPLAQNNNLWIMSADGWPESVRIVNTNNDRDTVTMAYPSLYGSSFKASVDGRFLFMIRYGFEDEGGGLWVTDLADEDFAEDLMSSARIVAWDHALQWLVLEQDIEHDPPIMHVLLMGKEVDAGFLMTANYVRLTQDGLFSQVLSQERLLTMVGWNPLAFAYQVTGEGKYRVLVETSFNYEGYLLPRARGVYVLPVDVSE